VGICKWLYGNTKRLDNLIKKDISKLMELSSSTCQILKKEGESKEWEASNQDTGK